MMEQVHGSSKTKNPENPIGVQTQSATRPSQKSATYTLDPKH